MIITLNDKQTRLLSEVVEAGGAHSTEEAVDQAVRALHSLTIVSPQRADRGPSVFASKLPCESAIQAPFCGRLFRRKPVHQQVDNLAGLFAKSPFRGLDMTFERDQDTGRDIPL
jgi:hypothetical protein